VPTPLSRRATAAVFLGVAIAVATILISFIWPGFVPTNLCASSLGPFQSVNGRTYCYTTVPFPANTPDHYGNYSEWGVGFHLFFPATELCIELVITIIEPNLSKYSGGMSACPPNANLTGRWFTPDGEAGVTTTWMTLNASLLVLR